ncbi:unnamed protein product [Ceutorhynchus assimilis]|uniref:Uncharacterized protein n=1 Tax=Ceutorhynchus assimilis TaxID=467358 RepID=A0A9N9QN25_9CUCU|nr:unnamed protein product [Ceutorhynchus assimilis]
MDKLDLEKATKVCRAHEIPSAQVKELQGTSSEVKIDALKRNNSRPYKTFQKSRDNRHVTEGNMEAFDCRSCGLTHAHRQCLVKDAAIVKNMAISGKCVEIKTNAVIRKEFGENDYVVIQEGKTWLPAIVTKKLDTLRSYIVQRNSSHIRPSRGHHQ